MLDASSNFDGDFSQERYDQLLPSFQKFADEQPELFEKFRKVMAGYTDIEVSNEELLIIADYGLIFILEDEDYYVPMEVYIMFGKSFSEYLKSFRE